MADKAFSSNGTEASGGIRKLRRLYADALEPSYRRADP